MPKPITSKERDYHDWISEAQSTGAELSQPEEMMVRDWQPTLFSTTPKPFACFFRGPCPATALDFAPSEI